jgi:uncharacterized protein YdhG (YjbR/CyaY superfamily)
MVNMSVIDNYLYPIAAPKRAELEKIRKLVTEIAPKSEEVISYGMPGFKYEGKYLLGFNAFKDHLSLFPTSEPIEAFKNELTGFTLSKGTIQFTVEHPIPETLVKDIIRHRLVTLTDR